jgi:hypothetical protein
MIDREIDFARCDVAEDCNFACLDTLGCPSLECHAGGNSRLANPTFLVFPYASRTSRTDGFVAPSL